MDEKRSAPNVGDCVDGFPIDRVLRIPGSSDLIVLLEYSAPGRPKEFQNLLRCSTDGTVVWRAELPDKVWEAYTSCTWDGDRLTASSWTGFYAHLDPATGRIVDKVFSK